MSDVSLLLNLQEIDLEHDRVERQKVELPERAQLASAFHEAAQARANCERATSARNDVANQQATIDNELKEVEQRITSINERLYGASNVGAKDAQAMSAELTQLATQRSNLEDADLVLMEQLENLEAALQAANEEARGVARNVSSLQSSLGSKEAELDVELQKLIERRQPFVSQLSPQLLTRYESLRSHLGGVAIAQLEGNRCGGCHIEMAKAELAAIRSNTKTEIPTCEECGRMLVFN